MLLKMNATLKRLEMDKNFFQKYCSSIYGLFQTCMTGFLLSCGVVELGFPAHGFKVTKELKMVTKILIWQQNYSVCVIC